MKWPIFQLKVSDSAKVRAVIMFRPDRNTEVQFVDDPELAKALTRFESDGFQLLESVKEKDSEELFSRTVRLHEYRSRSSVISALEQADYIVEETQIGEADARL